MASCGSMSASTSRPRDPKPALLTRRREPWRGGQSLDEPGHVVVPAQVRREGFRLDPVTRGERLRRRGEALSVSGHEEEIVASRTQLLREFPSDARRSRRSRPRGHGSPLESAARGRFLPPKHVSPADGAKPARRLLEHVLRLAEDEPHQAPPAAFPEEAGARHRCHAYLAREPHRERGVVGRRPPARGDLRERREVGEDVVGALRRRGSEPRLDQRVLQQIAARPVTLGESADRSRPRAPRARPPLLPGAGPARRRSGSRGPSGSSR